MAELPIGVKILNLKTHHDDRGDFTEILRREWLDDLELVQWNLSNSKANCLRGFHLHHTHWDYLICLRGSLHLALKDLRINSPTYGLVYQHTFDDSKLQAITIPPGVGHGFYFTEESLHINAVTHYWDVDDELACHWKDPNLGIEWGISDPIISKKDEEATSLEVLLDTISKYQDRLWPK